MNKTVVINIVGLSPRLFGKDTPFLKSYAEKSGITSIKPQIPAVTTTVQSSFVTGKTPAEHGIVGNGWYFRDESEIKFWKQSNKLVTSPKIWETAKEIDPSFTCANICWWYNMYSAVDFSVTPRPIYCADGRKIPDCYTYPDTLREDLTKKLGNFPLFTFWGPATSIKSTQWIANAAKHIEEAHSPTLSFVYLPHLDYGLQKFGSMSPEIKVDLQQIDAVCKDLIEFYEARGTKIVLLSEYGITDVDKPVHLNRVLRNAGLLAVRNELGLEVLDAGASDAFAAADHQIAHVYVKEEKNIPLVHELLKKTDGVESIFGEEEKKKHGLNHSRSGELVVMAKKNAWFTYYYWLDDAKAPDFARTVDIHRKPGYDPVELFLNPANPFIKLKTAFRIAQKKLGFRALLDVIPLDASLVKGSHGRYPDSPEEAPLIISPEVKATSTPINATEIHDLVLRLLTES